ncbi:MAG: tetratricopeptide repeat protein [Myxococcota bacterium]
MDVSCPQCETLYEVEERQLRGGGATLKCSQCDHVFRLQTSLALNRENQRRWMLRNTQNGDILYFSEFDQLHRWIMEGEATKDDSISRTGERWTRLEDIGEFMPIFKAVDSISSLQNTPAVQRAGSVPDAEGSAPSEPGSIPPSPESSQNATVERDSAPHQRPQTGQRSRVRTSQQFPLDSVNDTGKSAQTADGSQPSSHPKPAPQQGGPSTGGASPQSSPTPSKPAGRQDSSSTGSQPSVSGASSTGPQRPVNRSSSGSGMRTPASDRARGRAKSSGDSFDSGPLAGATGEDEWSFGEGSGLNEDPRTTTGEFDAASQSSSSRLPVVLLVLVLLVGGAAAGVYFFQPGLVDDLIATGEEPAVPIEGEEQQPVEEPVEGDSAQETVSSALVKAEEAVHVREGELFMAAVEPAHAAIGASVVEAKKAADKAAEEPDPDEMLRRARRLLERGDSDRARKKYHEVLELQRTNVEAVTGLGWSLLAAGSPASAAAQFRRATSINSSYGDAYIGLGKAERQLGNKQAAIEAYSTYLSRFPGGSKSSIAKYQKEKLEDELGE